MGNRFIDVLGLIVVGSIIATLAAKPQIVGTFFTGFSGALRASQGR